MITIMFLATLATTTLAQWNSVNLCDSYGFVCYSYTESSCHGSCPSGFSEVGRGRKFTCAWWAGTYAKCEVYNYGAAAAHNCKGVIAASQCKGKYYVNNGRRSEGEDTSVDSSMEAPDLLGLLAEAENFSDEVSTDVEVEGDFRALVDTLKRLEVLVEEVEHANDIVEDLVAKMEKDAEETERTRWQSTLHVTASQATVPSGDEDIEVGLEITYAQALGQEKPEDVEARRLSGQCCKTSYQNLYCSVHPLHWHQCTDDNGYSYDHSKKSSGSGCWWGQGRGWCSNPCGGRLDNNGKCQMA